MKHGLACVVASSARASGFHTSGVDGALGQCALLAGSRRKYPAAN